MKTTSEFAKKFFKKGLDWAEKYGLDQYEHSIRVLTERFHQEAFLAASAAIIDDVIAEHDRCLTQGLVDEAHDPAIEKSAVTIAGHNALSVRYADGNNLLFVFSEKREGENDDEKMTSTLEVISWADPVPAAAFAEYRANFKNATCYADLGPSINKLADFGAGQQIAVHPADDKLAMEFNDLVSAIEEGGSRSVRGVGRFTRNAFGFMLRNNFFTFNAFCSDECTLNVINRMFSAFKPLQEYNGSTGDEYFALLKTGQLDEAFASGCALSFEYHLQRGAISAVQGIVDASEELGLGMEFSMAYHDTKISVYGERQHDRDIYVNKDLDGSCTATVVSKIDGVASTVHVYDLQTWWAGFLNYWGHTETDPLIEGKELEYVRYALTRGSSLSEHDLLDQLRDGVLPEEPATLIYDIQSGVLNIVKSVEHSDYLTFLTSRMKRDQEIVENAVKGEFPEWGAEFHEHSRGDTFYQHLDVEDFLARKAAPSL